MSTNDDLKALRTVKRALYRFNAFDPKMQVSTILTLLEIADSELRGEVISVQQIEQSVGLLSGTASRNVYYWAEGHKDMRGGHEMITVTFGHDDRRRRDLRLTPKGRAFINQLIEGVK